MQRREGEPLKLTTRIKYAEDGWLDLEVVELPELVVHAKTFEDIPQAVCAAAGAFTGRPDNEFEVDIEL